jgi:hypothetical protein
MADLISVDANSLAGLVTVLGALTAAIVTITNAITSNRDRKALIQKVDDAAAAQLEVKHSAVVIASHVEATATQLNAIQSTAEASAKNVDGNLADVKQELLIMAQHNKALLETVATLTGLLRTRETTPLTVAVPAKPIPVEITNTPLETRIEEKR